MHTKYGDYSSMSLEDYKQSLINRVWCLIPLREEKCPTINQNIERLNRELHGLIGVCGEQNKYIISIIHLLENSLNEDDFQVYRSDILRCCELIKKIGGANDV